MHKIPSISSEISPLKNGPKREDFSSTCSDRLNPADVEQFHQKIEKNSSTKSKNFLSSNASEKRNESPFTVSNQIHQKLKKESDSSKSFILNDKTHSTSSGISPLKKPKEKISPSDRSNPLATADIERFHQPIEKKKKPSIFVGKETKERSCTHSSQVNTFGKSCAQPSKVKVLHQSYPQPSPDNALGKSYAQRSPKGGAFREKFPEMDATKAVVSAPQSSQGTKVDRKGKINSQLSNAFVGIPFLQPAAPHESITVQNLSSTQASRANDAAFLIQQIQQQVIDHVLTSTDEIHANRTVLIQLSPKLLEGTTIEFSQKGTSLNIQLISDHPDSLTFLQAHQVPLQTHLQNELQTYQSVNVYVRDHTPKDSSQQEAHSDHQPHKHSNHSQTDQAMEEESQP